jgi:hypothetical protein
MLLSVIFTLPQRDELLDPLICAEVAKNCLFFSPQQQLESLTAKLGYEIVKVPEPRLVEVLLYVSCDRFLVVYFCLPKIPVT